MKNTEDYSEEAKYIIEKLESLGFKAVENVFAETFSKRMRCSAEEKVLYNIPKEENEYVLYLFIYDDGAEIIKERIAHNFEDHNPNKKCIRFEYNFEDQFVKERYESLLVPMINNYHKIINLSKKHDPVRNNVWTFSEYINLPGETIYFIENFKKNHGPCKVPYISSLAGLIIDEDRE